MTLNSRIRYWRVMAWRYWRVGDTQCAIHARRLYFMSQYRKWVGEMAQAVIG